MAAIVLTSGTVLVISVITGSASPVDSSLHQCVINENITKFPHPGLDCCQNKDHWIVEDKAADDDEGAGSYKCVADFLCLSNNETGAWVRGQCKVFFADGVCGEVGQRLYVGPDGNGTCDCEENWIRHEDRCYQEFTQAFCADGKVLNLGTRRKLKNGARYSCVRNPCDEDTLAHSSTWKDRHCHPLPEEVDDIAECELVPSNVHEDGSRLKCCDPSERSSCEEQNSINPASLPGQCKRPGCCKLPKKIFSRPQKKCVDTFNHRQG